MPGNPDQGSVQVDVQIHKVKDYWEDKCYMLGLGCRSENKMENKFTVKFQTDTEKLTVIKGWFPI